MRKMLAMTMVAMACTMLGGCGGGSQTDTNNSANEGTVNDGLVDDGAIDEDVTDDTLDSVLDETETSDDTTMDTADVTEYTTYTNETKWGKITSVNDNGFTMDVGILDDSNAFSVNDEKANVTLNADTEIRMSAFNDAMNTDDRDMQDATIDNLKVGDLVAVEFDSEGEVDSVIIKMPTNE